MNHATHEYKEQIKVGYNLRRKTILLSIWAASPLVLVWEPTLFGTFEAHQDPAEFVDHMAQLWLIVGIGGLLFRTLHLFFVAGVQTGLVWLTKIVTDPLHDVKLYHRAPLLLLRGEGASSMHSEGRR